MRKLQSQTKIYRPQSGKGQEPDGIVSPAYRGFKITCAAREIPALQRNIDAHWYARHAAAVTPAEREALNMEERAMRFQPREWTQ